MSKILVSGGLGYIGSHACVSLAEAGLEMVIVDSLVNSEEDVAGKIAELSGGKRPKVYIGSLSEKGLLERIFEENEISAVMHFAALKSVPESVEKPLSYYENNLGGILRMLRVMEENDCRTLIFSSSACVYAPSESAVLREDSPLSPTNPYGWTKLMTERILEDLCASDERWSAALLRYFNPVGAHPSGLIGEIPFGRPGNLMPRIVRAAAGLDEYLPVTGTDYPTPDGSGVRDYIHVMDLAEGHVSALKYAMEHRGAVAMNLGSGKGVSVLELIEAFERSTGVKVPWKSQPRRAGDLAAYYADPAKAWELLGWKTTRTIDEMCADSWRFAKKYLEEKKQ